MPAKQKPSKRPPSSPGSQGKWRKVEIDPAQSMSLDGFVGLEELTDYSTASVKGLVQVSEPELEPVVLEKKVKKAAKKPEKPAAVRSPDAVVQPPAKSKSVALMEVKEKTPEGPAVEPDAQTIEPFPAGDMSAWTVLGVNDAICASLDEMNFMQPTPIQAAVLPRALLARRDIVGAAETGSGKTLAFGISIIQHLMQKQNDNTLSALVIVPTRELALQVSDHLKAIAKHTKIHVVPIVGGLALQKQERLLGYKPQIIVGTPGRLWELIQSGHPHFRSLPDLKFLVIDEADRMLETGHFEELSSIIERANSSAVTFDDSLFDQQAEDPDFDDSTNEPAAHAVPLLTLPPSANRREVRKRQTFVFSATLSLNAKKQARPSNFKGKGKKEVAPSTIEKIIEKCELRPKYFVADLTAGERKVAHGLTEAKIVCTVEERDVFLYYLLKKYPGRSLIFVNSINCMKRLMGLLGHLQVVPMAIHAHMQQRQRLRSLEKFKARSSSVLIATDVAARGLDVQGIDHVIHYQLPRQPDIYVHRSGRTARANTEGLSITLLTPEDVPNYQKIVRDVRSNAELPLFPVELKFMSAVKKRVSLATRIEKFESTNHKTQHHNEWARKAAEEMDIIIDDLDDILEDDSDRAQEMREAAKLKEELGRLLKDEILPVHVSKTDASAVGRVNSVLMPLSKASISALDLAKERESKFVAMAQQKKQAEGKPKKKRPSRSRKHKLAMLEKIKQSGEGTAEPEAKDD